MNRKTLKEEHLSHQVKDILEVPPGWIIRNGGFLILAFIAVVYFLLNAINIPQRFNSAVRFEQQPGTAISEDVLVGKVVVPIYLLKSIEGGQIIHMVKQNKTREKYDVSIAKITKYKDSAILHLNISQLANRKQFHLIPSGKTTDFNMEFGKISMMAEILGAGRKN